MPQLSRFLKEKYGVFDSQARLNNIDFVFERDSLKPVIEPPLVKAAFKQIKLKRKLDQRSESVAA